RTARAFPPRADLRIAAGRQELPGESVLVELEADRRGAKPLWTDVGRSDEREVVAGDRPTPIPARQVDGGVDQQPAQVVRRTLPLARIAGDTADPVADERRRELLGELDEARDRLIEDRGRARAV